MQFLTKSFDSKETSFSLVKTSFLLSLFISLVNCSFSQNLIRITDIEVKEFGNTLQNPFSGGLNLPQFSPIDLNEDGEDDLFLFDRSANFVATFLYTGSGDQSGYKYSPEYHPFFPKMSGWCLLVDYNCDGKPDIFTSYADSSAITVYKNTSDINGISFTLETEILKTPIGKIFVASTDIPAIKDIDGDGDIDILTFDSQGSHVRFFENTAVDPCDLAMIVSDNCWGKFEENGLNNGIVLDASCKRSTSGGLHAGSTLNVFDADDDGLMELLLGDLNHDNIVYLHNAGGVMDEIDISYPPSTTPIDLRRFPASFYMDVTRDGKPDLLVAPNAGNISRNVENIWLYEDISTSNSVSFDFRSTSFLVDEMIDCGEATHPIFFDYNSDGLQDIMIGNFLKRTGSSSAEATLTVYENTGSAVSPEFALATKNYLDIPSMFNPQLIDIHPAIGDIDNDGDIDMILGGNDGKLHYLKNIATSGNQPDFILFEPNYQGIDIGGNSSPQLIDINRDGKLDLLVGETGGNVNYFENTGTPESAVFGAPNELFGGIDVVPNCCGGFSVPFAFQNSAGAFEIIVGSEEGKLFHYGNIDGNLTGNFDLISSDFSEIFEGIRISPFGADLNQDDVIEWIFGNQKGGISLYKKDNSNSINHQHFTSNISAKVLYQVNSTEDLLQIERIQPIDLTLEIMNINGEIVGKYILPPNINHFPLHFPELPNGIYLLRLAGKKGIIPAIKWMKMP